MRLRFYITTEFENIKDGHVRNRQNLKSTSDSFPLRDMDKQQPGRLEIRSKMMWLQEFTTPASLHGPGAETQTIHSGRPG